LALEVRDEWGWKIKLEWKEAREERCGRRGNL
jgi:hypothetical protein